MKEFKTWLYSMLTVIILGLIAYSVYIGKKQVDSIINGIVNPIGILLNVIVYCLIVLIISACILAISYGVVYVLKHYHATEISEISQYGNVLVRRNKHTVVAPFHIEEVKTKSEKAVKQLEEKPAIPTMRELLITGYISQLLANAQMLLGYSEEDLNEYTGNIDETRTSGVLGKSRSGKTVHMCFLILQYVLANANVFLVDRAYNKQSSLYNLLKPLIEEGYIKVARKPLEIINLVDEFTSILDMREQNEETDMTETAILIFDEFTSFSRDKLMMKKLSSIVHRIANESAGFNAYAIIGGQNVQASLTGGNALINSIHSWFTFKIDFMESKRILAKRYATLTETLKVGRNFFRNTSGETLRLITPLTTMEDAYLVLAILQGKPLIGSTVSPYRQAGYYHKAFQPYNPKLLDIAKEHENKIPAPTMPLKPVEEAVSIKPPATPSLPDMISEDKQIRISAMEQEEIKAAIVTAISQGKVKGNGKVVRTVVRDMLGYDNRAYQKIQVYCDVHNY